MTYFKMSIRRVPCKRLIQVAAAVYIIMVIFSLTNRCRRCRVEMLTIFANPAFTDYVEGGKCRINWNQLGLTSVNLNENASILDIQKDNEVVAMGGKWAPSDCHAWQKVAVIIPYRDRWQHLKLLLKRLHTLLQKQKISYQIFVVDQDGKEKFNRGRLLNIGVVEALKSDSFDCFIFHDVDLLPENDRNIYYCDKHVRHLASAIDEMRYHVMYYNYAGGVIAMSKESFFTINGYSNIYWGWGNEDDDFSARTREAGLLLTRPPENIGRYKMVRHEKQWRSDNGNGLFFTWRSRWKIDGLSSLDDSMYKLISKRQMKLYTHFAVDIGRPPDKPPIDANAQKESLVWFLTFFFP